MLNHGPRHGLCQDTVTGQRRFGTDRRHQVAVFGIFLAARVALCSVTLYLTMEAANYIWLAGLGVVMVARNVSMLMASAIIQVFWHVTTTAVGAIDGIPIEGITHLFRVPIRTVCSWRQSRSSCGGIRRSQGWNNGWLECW